MNALVASAKSPPALAIIRSLGIKHIEVTGASDEGKAYPLYSKYCKKRIILKSPHGNAENRIEELFEIIKWHRFDVFFPVMPEELLFALSKHKKEFEQYTKVALPPADQLNILNNKAKVSELLAILQIPRPVTYCIDGQTSLDALLKEATFPMIIKPILGEGARGVRIIPDAKTLYTSYQNHISIYGPCFVQEYIYGEKHTAVFLLNNHSEVRRFFVHHALREYPPTGGPTCFLESVKYEPIFEYGLKLLKAVHFTGLASMEFIIDKHDNKPKIIDVNPRFYGPVQCAISAGVDLPYDVYKIALDGDIETDLSYKTGITCRNLLFEDTKHMISILRGAKSPKYTLGKTATFLNYLKFHQDDSYFIFSKSDPMPAFRKIFHYHLFKQVSHL